MNDKTKIFARWDVSKNWGDALNPILIKHLSGVEPIWIDYPKPGWFNWLRDIFVRWDVSKNFVDAVGPRLIKHLSGVDLSGVEAIWIDYFKHGFNWLNWKKNQKASVRDIYLVVGSILQKADKDTVVWGPGFISKTCRLKEKPKKICAVRGPLSRRIILNQGIECPEIYGDPAMLYPKFYNPSVKKKYKLGIIPHFIDQNLSLLDKFRKNPDVLIIDINGGINNVVDDICSCDRIASSSLHGIIASDAYGVPSIWIKFSDKVIGNGFKFRDYFASVGRADKSPLIINENTTFKTIYENFYDYNLTIDLDKLMDGCPFKK